MASQPVASGTAIINSYIRGYHAYMEVWTPKIGEVLVVKREAENPHHRYAVAIIKDGETVGHVPYNFAPIVSHFLKREVNKAFVEVTGDRINRGGGYGLEVPCSYKFYGPESYITKIKEVAASLKDKGLL
uniref:HIRAN domain-containing protein n=1 Tax=Amphimedon queenslandica TaxID=400682 RepID=A0A1X7UPP5_AMPQE